MQAFAFQPVRHESGIFRFECMKACLRHDLSPLVESAQLVTCFAWLQMQSCLATKRWQSCAAKIKEVIYQTRATVFHRDFQDIREES